MDYAMEQEMEVEALQSILMDDLHALVPGKVPAGWAPEGQVWRVEVSPQDAEEAECLAIAPKAELVFAHTAKYPEELPLLRVDAMQGLDDAELARVRAKATEAAEEYLGMASIYSVLQAMQEALDEVVAEQASRGGAGAGGLAAREETEEQRQARERAAEEARIAELRRHGTAVTPEAFHAWAETFEAEREAAKEAERAAKGLVEDHQKLTGKQWFLQQEALHRGVEEPELGEGEEDGEGDDRDTWECRRERASDDDEDDDLVFEDDDDDDELLNQLAAEKGL